MRPWLILTACASCGAPDRWHTSVSRGEGELYGAHSYEAEDTRLEIGVSGPIGRSTDPARPCPPPSASAPPPNDDSEIPWLEIALLASGAAAGKGSEVAYKKYRSRKAG